MCATHFSFPISDSISVRANALPAAASSSTLSMMASSRSRFESG